MISVFFYTSCWSLPVCGFVKVYIMHGHVLEVQSVRMFCLVYIQNINLLKYTKSRQ